MNVTKFGNNRLLGVVFGWLGFLGVLLAIMTVFLGLWRIGQDKLGFTVVLIGVALIVILYASYSSIG